MAGVCFRAVALLQVSRECQGGVGVDGERASGLLYPNVAPTETLTAVCFWC